MDCFSCFAPGQMGVALQTSRISGLRFNGKSAFTKHPDEVYEFYGRPITDFFPDLNCCKKIIISRLSSQSLNDEPSTSEEPLSRTVSSTHVKSYDDLP